MNPLWPDLPYDAWKDTYATLHMWMQIVGKVALAQAAPLNHSWGIAFQVTARGLSTRTLPHGSRSFTIEFDFIDHQLVIRTSDGAVRTLPLHRQGQPGAFLLGQLRSRGDAFLGPLGAAARWPRLHARRLFARSDQPRILARRWSRAAAGVLRVLGAGAGGIHASERPSRRRLLSRGARRVSAAVRRRAPRHGSGCGDSAVRRQHVR